MFCGAFCLSTSLSSHGRGGREPEIEVRIGTVRRGNVAHPIASSRAQCRFKMASVRDRYCGILVENVRISDVSGCESVRAVPWDLGAWAPHPAPSPGPL